MVKQAFMKTLPVMAGYVVLGTGFGILLNVNGYGLRWALLMSFFIYAGSLQYVGVSLLAGGASFLTTALTSFVVNARHFFYGISMIDRYKGAGLKKLYLMFGLTDETYSIVCNGEYPEGTNKYTYWLIISALNQSYWITGTIIGSMLSENIEFNSNGIEFSMTAFFVTVFAEQWLAVKEHRPALIGLAVTTICLLLFGRDNFLIPSMIFIVIALFIYKKALIPSFEDSTLNENKEQINNDSVMEGSIDE